jgi:phosphatidate cytidylyltransferase
MRAVPSRVGDVGDRIADDNVWRWVFGSDVERLRLHLGPLDVTGRGVWFFGVAVVVLLVAGAAALVVRKREITEKWLTWVCLAVLVGIPMWAGKATTVPIAIAVATVAVWEFARLVRLPRPETVYLHLLAVACPLTAYAEPELLVLVPFFALLSALPAVIGGDTERGLYRTTMTMFGSVWICWSLSFLIVIWKDAFLVLFAVAAADVGAWCGGRLLRRFRWGRAPLSRLSPNKTVGGLVGGFVLGALMLCVLGSVSLGLVLAVGFGATLGDLLESMVKRQVGVKDAGTWLPGFGGLLDRIDSWLLVLPLAAVLGVYLSW